MLTPDELKLATAAYSLASFDQSGQANKLWASVEEMRERLVSSFSHLFPTDRKIDFSAGAGWWPALQTAFQKFDELQKANPDFIFQFVQIKEKFGSLRVYYRIHHKDNDLNVSSYNEEEWKASGNIATPDEIFTAARAAIAEAEDKTYSQCELCGEPGEQIHGGWVRTLCPTHAKMFADQRNRRGF